MEKPTQTMSKRSLHKQYVVILAIFTLFPVQVFAFVLADSPKTTIKEVMRVTMTKGLAKKVIKGEASQEEKDQLVEQFVSMSKLTPSKGSQKSWDQYNTELIRLAKEVAEGKQSNDALAKAVNCVGCHKDHRPK